MQPFTRIVPKQNCEEWPSKLGKMGDLYHELEYQTVKKKIREAAIIPVYPENLDGWLEKVSKDRLIFIPLRKAKRGLGFSVNVESPKSGEPFYWLGCLVRTKKDGEIFKKADQKNDHKTMGEMLGYPSCCIEYFIKNFPINYDPIWVNFSGKIRGYPECNGMLRYFGPKITAHYSCSPTCKATQEIGKLWFKIMQEIDKDLAKEVYNLLAGPIVWNSYHGVVQVETPYFIGLSNSFPFVEKPKIIEWRAKKGNKISKNF
jgi:hypothetical protein